MQKIIRLSTICMVVFYLLACTACVITPIPTELPTETPAPVTLIPTKEIVSPAVKTFPISGNFIPSGYMGDIEDISVAEGDTITVSYSMTGSNGWAGVYWLNPANNWGTVEKAGYDLSWARKLVFSVRGTPGAQVEFFTGGVRSGKYPSSLGKFSAGFVTLQEDWQEITIPLENANLSYVIDGFGWSTSKAKNSGMPAEGIKFYLTNIHFE